MDTDKDKNEENNFEGMETEIRMFFPSSSGPPAWLIKAKKDHRERTFHKLFEWVNEQHNFTVAEQKVINFYFNTGMITVSPENNKFYNLEGELIDYKKICDYLGLIKGTIEN